MAHGLRQRIHAAGRAVTVRQRAPRLATEWTTIGLLALLSLVASGCNCDCWGSYQRCNSYQSNQPYPSQQEDCAASYDFCSATCEDGDLCWLDDESEQDAGAPFDVSGAGTERE